MSSRKTRVTGLLVLALASATPGRAQIPGSALPGGGASAANSAMSAAGLGSTAGAAPAAAAAAPQTIWGFFGLSSANIHACIAKLCKSQLGQMANSMITGPVGAVSGGFIPPLCPAVPSAEQIKQMEAAAPGGAAATAAKIKASEADAKARVAAVEYLGTVDCSRWKEATKALVFSLREDPNECVRYAAARVLNSGCCCNKETIEALRICVSGEDKGAPAETSARVKAAAFSALQNCLTKVPEVLPEEEKKPIEREGGPDPDLKPIPDRKPIDREKSTMADAEGTHLAASHTVAAANRTFEDRLRNRTLTETVNDARATLFHVSRTARPPSALPPGKRSVFNALIRARQDMARKSTPPPGAMPAPAGPSVVPGSYTPEAAPAIER